MAMVRPVLIDDEAKKIHIPVALFASFIILVIELSCLGSAKAFINRANGLLLVLLFIAYFAYPIFKEIKDIKQAYKEAKKNDNNK